MKKTSSPPPSFSRILLTIMALFFLGIQAHAQRTFPSNYQVFDKGIRINGDNNYGNTEALSLHPTVTFELDAPGIVGGRFGITTDGRVGIGNNKANFPLDLVHKGGTEGILAQFYNQSNNSGIHLGGYPSGAVVAAINQTALLLNPDGGNVGIGVADPGFLLDVAAPKDKLIAGWASQFKNATTNTGVHFGGRKDIGIIGSLGTTPLHINPDGGHIHLGSPTNAEFDITAHGKFTSGHITTTGLTVDNGNVGIGVAAPDEKLEVAGSIKATGKIIADGGIEMNGSEALHFASNGNVGIGVSSPKAKLDVAGNIKATGKIIADGGIEMNGSEALHFASNGNVGIGKVASPTTKLDVAGVIKATGLYVSSAFPESYIRMEKGTLSLHPDVPFEVDTYQYRGGRFKVDKEGNVGIGVPLPKAKLDVAGDIKATGKIIADGGLQLNNNNNNISENIYFAENGDVGIGVEPGTGENRKGKLHVKGSFHVENEDNQVFHVSSTKELVFVGNEAYDKWLSNKDNPKSQLFENEDNYSLWVSKGIVSEDYVMATVDKWADHVFDLEYELPSLEELSHFVRTNKHLPNIPSEAEVQQHGYSLKEVDLGLLQNLEELTLHTLAQEEKITALEAQLEQLKTALAQLQENRD